MGNDASVGVVYHARIAAIAHYAGTTTPGRETKINMDNLFSVFVFTALYIQVSTLQSMKATPVVISSTNISGECPLADERQAARQQLQVTTREIIQTSYGIQITECGSGNWKRVFYLNASQPDQLCPSNWSLLTSPVRGCAGAGSECRSAFSRDIDTPYSKVCGRITGEGVSSPDGFVRSPQDTTLEGNYLDGVSITHGTAGSRTHIWTFAAGHSATDAGWVARCPCDNSNRGEAPLPPAQVGDNYFCDRADELDRLWTGANCTSDNPCCSFHRPPYFSVQLPSATTDRIELRLCLDQVRADENILVLYAEIYVQ